jgi:hypothetical protein
MGSFEIVIGTVLLGLVGFQIWLTSRVFRSRIYERKQKIWQAQLIWLVPILGAGIVFAILQEDDTAERRASSHLKS